jgi:hypothetical protein
VTRGRTGKLERGPIVGAKMVARRAMKSSRPTRHDSADYVLSSVPMPLDDEPEVGGWVGMN